MNTRIPVTAVIATRNRPRILKRTIDTLWAQKLVRLTECLIIDASTNNETASLCEDYGSRLKHRWATKPGAASQRNEGTAIASQAYILYLDDDIIIQPDCLARVWSALQASPEHGGASAMITNEKYQPPGLVSRFIFACLRGSSKGSYAGQCFGPGITQLPSDSPDLPEVVPVQWMNTGFAMYRREALPSPPFDKLFYGASVCEDLALSLRVSKNWALVNARCAEIYHDSQPGEHKASLLSLTRMELINRHYVSTHILERKEPGYLLGLLFWHAFKLIALSYKR